MLILYKFQGKQMVSDHELHPKIYLPITPF